MPAPPALMIFLAPENLDFRPDALIPRPYNPGRFVIFFLHLYNAKKMFHGVLAANTDVIRGGSNVVISPARAVNRIHGSKARPVKILSGTAPLIFSAILFLGLCESAFADRAIATATQFQIWAPGTSAENFDEDNCRAIFAADVNGDEMIDMICVSRSYPGYEIRNVSSQTFVQIAAADGKSATAWQAGSPALKKAEFNIDNCTSFAAADVNNDRKTDLICLWEEPGTSRVYVQKNFTSVSQNSWVQFSPDSMGSDYVYRWCAFDLLVHDVDKDGFEDLVCASGNFSGVALTEHDPYPYPIYVSLGNTAVNSEQVFGEWINWVDSDQTAPAAENSGPVNCLNVLISDVVVNGDSQTILVCPIQNTNVRSATFWSAYLTTASSAGWNSYTYPNFNVGIMSSGQNGCFNVVLADLWNNGDPNLLCPQDDKTMRANSSDLGQWFYFSAKPGENISIPDAPLACRYLVGDVNGDLYPDLICPNFGTNDTYVQLGVPTPGQQALSWWTAWSSETRNPDFDRSLCERVFVADVNNDGYDDLLCPSRGSVNKWQTWVQFGTGGGSCIDEYMSPPCVPVSTRSIAFVEETDSSDGPGSGGADAGYAVAEDGANCFGSPPTGNSTPYVVSGNVYKCQGRINGALTDFRVDVKAWYAGNLVLHKNLDQWDTGSIYLGSASFDVPIGGELQVRLIGGDRNSPAAYFDSCYTSNCGTDGPCTLKIFQEAVSSRYPVSNAGSSDNPNGAFAQISFNLSASAKITSTGNQGTIDFSASGYPATCP